MIISWFDDVIAALILLLWTCSFIFRLPAWRTAKSGPFHFDQESSYWVGSVLSLDDFEE